MAYQDRSRRRATTPKVVPNSMFIFGLGFTGMRLATKLAKQGWKVAGTVQSLEKKIEIEQEHQNIKVVVVSANSTEFDLQPHLVGVTHILATAPVNKKTGEDPILEKFGKLISTLSINGKIFWAGYLSTTSVYGDHKGGWVDESMETAPTLKRGRLRKHAEESWLSTGML